MKFDLGKTIKWTAIAAIGGGIAFTAYAAWQQNEKTRDGDLAKSDVAIADNGWGDGFTQVKHLPQGWKDWETLFFYNTTQGSDLLPYDFFLELQIYGSDQLVRGDTNINRWRYLPRRATPNNPDALPVGFVKDEYKGRDYFGFTCAACHTGEIVHNNIALRIEGGQTLADMDGFMKQLATSLAFTNNDPARRQAFVERVLARGSYKSKDAVEKDLAIYAQRVALYNVINASPQTAYGHGRLDAFGRIFNRVLENLLTTENLKQVLVGVVDQEAYAKLAPIVDSSFKSGGRDGVIYALNGDIERIVAERYKDDPESGAKLAKQWKDGLFRAIFNTPDAPVSYPFLWDIVQHDYVQWNGIASNAGLGPLGRNTGEVIGVFGTLDWKTETGFSLASFISNLVSGQKATQAHVNFASSVDSRNLGRLENQLTALHSPAWPADVLGKVDASLAYRGDRLFGQYCVQCHAEINATDPGRHVVANFTSIGKMGTDPTMANNATGRVGYSGLVLNQYVGAGVGNLVLEEKAPVAALLTKATLSVVVTPDSDSFFVHRWANRIYDLVTSYNQNEISASLKRGSYDADTTVNPYASLGAYKGRPLNGIWATAPYLHNGSVPTLYDILLPPCADDAPRADPPVCRPSTFMVGSRKFDPKYVGLLSEGYDGFKFDTRTPGNSNAGHDYGTKPMKLPDGSTLPALTHEDRLALVEYMKIIGLSEAEQLAVAQ